MALVIYDQGYRIQTPVRSNFPPTGVEQLTNLSPSMETATQADHERDLIAATQHKESQQNSARAHQKAANIYQQARSSNPAEAEPRSYIPAAMIMSQPVQSVLSGSPIRAALYKMQQLRIDHLIVLSGQGLLLGVVTKLLLMQALSKASLMGKELEDTINGCYDTKVVTATPETNIRQLAVTCVDKKLTCIPIVSEEGDLKGIVTRTDLLQSLINNEWLDSRGL